MKINAMNDFGRLKESVLEGVMANGKIRATLMTLAGLVALIVINGCASARAHGDDDVWHYNPNTDYPAVGAGRPWK